MAKQHYLEDSGYTRGDIIEIAGWLDHTIRFLQKSPAPDNERVLETLLQVEQKFIKEGILEDPAEKRQPITLDFLTLPEREIVLKALKSFSEIIKSADLREKSIIARKHVLDDKDYTVNDLNVIILSLGMVKNLIETNVSFPEGTEVEYITNLLELADSVKEKIKHEYRI